jgi:putative oxidoreductase
MSFATEGRRTMPALRALEGRLADWLARYSIDLLRISLGLVFLGFGALKFVPGLSPAEGLATSTLEIVTLGVVPDGAGLIMVAALESTIGVLLLTGRWLRVALALLAVELAGILSPLVLLPGAMFGPGLAPTLAGQYVLKDVILVAAALVIGARVLGARLVVERR